MMWREHHEWKLLDICHHVASNKIYIALQIIQLDTYVKMIASTEWKGSNFIVEVTAVVAG